MPYAPDNYRLNDYPLNLLTEIFSEDDLPDLTDPKLSERLDQFFAALDPKLAQALWNRYRFQMTYSDAGEAMGISVEAARQRISKGLRIMRHPKWTSLIVGKEKELPRRELPAPSSPDYPIGGLGLPVNAYNTLLRAGIGTVGQLLALSTEDLLWLYRMGPKTYQSILERLEVHGYSTAHFDKHPDFSMK